MVGSGAALIDYDNDGEDMDVFWCRAYPTDPQGKALVRLPVKARAGNPATACSGTT